MTNQGTDKSKPKTPKLLGPKSKRNETEEPKPKTPKLLGPKSKRHDTDDETKPKIQQLLGPKSKRKVKITSKENISDESKYQETDKTNDDTLRASIRNRNLFNAENRKVPLNRFRGRQRIVKVVQKTENENGDVVLSEVTGPGASQRPRGNRRPVAIRRRPIGRRRRPINDDQEEIIEEEKKAFLVCSGGKCFRYDDGITILYTGILTKKVDL